MKILDCTLRDGANVVGCGFSPELTLSMVRALIQSGITDIEMGNAKGIGSYERGAAAPLNDIEYAELVQPYKDRASLGMFMLAKQADEQKLLRLKELGLSFVRVGNAAGNGQESLEAVHMVKSAGLKCRYALMKAYVCTPNQLAQEALLLQENGADGVTIMDSAGTMFPEDVMEYVRTLKRTVKIPVGFHGHSNLGMSAANALAAAETGADEIDGGLLGMARSAGNCATELAIAVLLKKGLLDNTDLFKLLHYEEDELIPAMLQSGYHAPVLPVDLMLGLTGCHSSFLPLFRRISEEENTDLFLLIEKVSAIDRKAPTEALIRHIAAELKENA